MQLGQGKASCPRILEGGDCVAPRDLGAGRFRSESIGTVRLVAPSGGLPLAGSRPELSDSRSTNGLLRDRSSLAAKDLPTLMLADPIACHCREDLSAKTRLIQRLTHFRLRVISGSLSPDWRRTRGITITMAGFVPESRVTSLAGTGRIRRRNNQGSSRTGGSRTP